MGTVWEELTVKNAEDLMAVKRGYMKASDVRQTTVRFKADTGAFTNVLTEDMAKALGLTIEGDYPAKLVGGVTRSFGRAGSIEIWWRDRHVLMGDTLVVQNGANNLLSVVAMELLDVMPDVKTRRLVGVHGDEWVCEIE